MKTRVMTNARVEADLDAAIYRPKDMADYTKQLERAAKEFNEFVRDHRSMDWVSLNVVREYEDQCSHCGYVWETNEEGAPVCCQEAIEEHEGGVFSAMGMDAAKLPNLVAKKAAHLAEDQPQ